MNKPFFCRNFLLIDLRHKSLKNTIDPLLSDGQHFYGLSESEFKIHDVKIGLTNNCNTHIVQCLTK